MSKPERVYKEPLLTKDEMEREWSFPPISENQDNSDQKKSDDLISTENAIQVTFFKRSKGTSAPSNENL